MRLSVIIPVRDQADTIQQCLESVRLALHAAEIDSELIVVDDLSSDNTFSIAASFPEVIVVRATPGSANAVGKNRALVAGFEKSRGELILFLDGDVCLSKNSLKDALHLVAERELASLSPEQTFYGFWDKSLHPILFRLFDFLYPFHKVCDPEEAVAAANGQFILMKRDFYEKIGTHAAFLREVLEDVAIAKATKAKGGRLYFGGGKQYGVSASMYQDFAGLLGGWSKNLYLLARENMLLTSIYLCGLWLAVMVLWLLPMLAWERISASTGLCIFLLANAVTMIIFRSYARFYTLLHLSAGVCLFNLVILRSWYWHEILKRVLWKGRWIELT